MLIIFFMATADVTKATALAILVGLLVELKFYPAFADELCYTNRERRYVIINISLLRIWFFQTHVILLAYEHLSVSTRIDNTTPR